MQLNETARRVGEGVNQKLAVIDLQLLTDPSDVDVLLKGINIGLSVLEYTPEFQRAGAQYSAAPHPERLDH